MWERMLSLQKRSIKILSPNPPGPSRVSQGVLDLERPRLLLHWLGFWITTLRAARTEVD